jgi:hypothetical protein
MEERIYMVSAEDELGDQHVFMTENRERALAAYHRLKAQYGTVRMNDAVADALSNSPAGHA